MSSVSRLGSIVFLQPERNESAGKCLEVGGEAADDVSFKLWARCIGSVRGDGNLELLCVRTGTGNEFQQEPGERDVPGRIIFFLNQHFISKHKYLK